MWITRSTVAVALIGTMALSGCGGKKDLNLMNIHSSTGGPDEFAILPGKPLQTPDFTAALPSPTPGGANLTDPTPHADAVAALGGDRARVSRTQAGNIGRGDGTIVAHARRFGVPANIRQVLAAEDLEHRRNNQGRILERWFNQNVYFKAYEEMSLNQHRELARFRGAGVRTPSAPPDPQIYGK